MKDLFSSYAEKYAAFRPTYPDELYRFIYSNLNGFDLAWDAGTGNGQVARELAKKFKFVYATDISARQLENAQRADNISYSVAGEETTFQDDSFDLVTVAQAIHWFDRKLFYDEVKRVAKKNAALAVWGYGLMSIDPELDKPLNDFYFKIVGPYWDSERKLIDDHYRSLDFPFNEIAVPEFSLKFSWTIEEFTGYLNTWSSVQKYIKVNNNNPVDKFIESISLLWRTERRIVSFPLFLRMGRMHES